MDVDPHAIALATAALPQHNFRIHDGGYKYPNAATVLFHATLLHIADDALIPLLIEAVQGRRRVIIAELMDPRGRRAGDPPVFNRDPEYYIFLMQELGVRLVHYAKPECALYGNAAHDNHMTILGFERASESFITIAPPRQSRPGMTRDIALATNTVENMTDCARHRQRQVAPNMLTSAHIKKAGGMTPPAPFSPSDAIRS